MPTAAPAAGALLNTAPPPIPAAEAAALVHAVFGIAGKMNPLTGERDQNFHLCATDGTEFVFKVAHPAEDAAIPAGQNAALQHIAKRDPAVPVPRVIPTLEGATLVTWQRAGEPPRMARLLSFLPGRMLHQVPSSAPMRRSLGALHARLGLALADFHLTGEDHDLLWDLRRAERLANLLEHVEDGAMRGHSARVLGAFSAYAFTRLSRLPHQPIHNDLNPHNAVVNSSADEVAGILDFGDMIDAPLICDVAVAASYLASTADGPLGGIADYVGAYNARRAFAPAELDILFDLIATRLTMTVLITAWRAKLFPENRTYILRNAGAAALGLERFAGVSRETARAMLQAACDKGSLQ